MELNESVVSHFKFYSIYVLLVLLSLLFVLYMFVGYRIYSHSGVRNKPLVTMYLLFLA